MSIFHVAQCQKQETQKNDYFTLPFVPLPWYKPSHVPCLIKHAVSKFIFGTTWERLLFFSRRASAGRAKVQARRHVPLLFTLPLTDITTLGVNSPNRRLNGLKVASPYMRIKCSGFATRHYEFVILPSQDQKQKGKDKEMSLK